MTKKQRYVAAGSVFMGIALFLLYPYLQARLKPITPVPETPVVEGEVAVGEPNSLKISDLGIEAPIIYITEKNETVYQEALKQGVVHYPGTALPGELGNVYIFGHSSDYTWSGGEYKTVFARLPQIELGTTIEVTDADGKLFRYIVTETKVVGPREMSVLDQFNYEKRMLSIQTSYPLGTALQRYIVVAELQEE